MFVCAFGCFYLYVYICVYIYVQTEHLPQAPIPNLLILFPSIYIATKSVVNNWTKMLRCPYMGLPPAVSFKSFSPCLISLRYHPKVSGFWKFLLPTLSGFVEFSLVFPAVERRPSVSTLTESHINIDRYHLGGSLYKHTTTKIAQVSSSYYSLYYLFLFL